MEKESQTKTPIDVIISSFKGDLSQGTEQILKAWLEEEGNDSRYEALHALWNTTIADACEVTFKPDSGFKKFRNVISNIWKRAATVASVAAALAICCALYVTLRPQPVHEQVHRCVTGKSVVTLPDGSTVILHNGSELIYNDDFACDNRNVSLKGEAFFDVVKDEDNEFVVNVSDVDIVVHGTTFNVNENSEKIVVSLVDGAVEVIAGDKTGCHLSPGQSATFNKDSGELIRHKDDVQFVSCWARDRLTFTQASLGEVCRYMSMWYRIEIVVPESLKESCSYTFTIREEPIDQILDIMSRINPMRYLYTNDRRIIISEIK